MLPGAEDSYVNDENTPVIPITPIEDDDAAADTSFGTLSPNTVSMSSQAQLSAPRVPAYQSGFTSNPNPPSSFIRPAITALGVEPDIVAAAYTALNAVMANSDQGNLIDPDLLVKILRDPNLMEKLGSGHRPNTNPQITPNPRLQGLTTPDPPPVHINRTEVVPSPLAATPSRPFYPPPLPPASRMGPVPNLRPPVPEVVLAPPPPSAGAPIKKDINYYKSLIQQHGGERPEPMSQYDNRHQQTRPSLDLASNPKSRDLRGKIMKPCIYFNSSRGCRNGANCAFQHDVSSQQRMPEVPSGKRMKMDREITGT